ncbi:hypothetical protein V1511DRAFT_498149 [Dipodascopsis uninucleata]
MDRFSGTQEFSQDTYTPTRPSGRLPSFELNRGYLLRLQSIQESPILYNRSQSQVTVNSPYILSPRIHQSLRPAKFKNIFSNNDQNSKIENRHDSFKSWIDDMKLRARRALEENEQNELEFNDWVETEDRKRRIMFELSSSIIDEQADDEKGGVVYSAAFEKLEKVLLGREEKIDPQVSDTEEVESELAQDEMTQDDADLVKNDELKDKQYEEFENEQYEESVEEDEEDLVVGFKQKDEDEDMCIDGQENENEDDDARATSKVSIGRSQTELTVSDSKNDLSVLSERHEIPEVELLSSNKDAIVIAEDISSERNSEISESSVSGSLEYEVESTQLSNESNKNDYTSSSSDDATDENSYNNLSHSTVSTVFPVDPVLLKVFEEGFRIQQNHSVLDIDGSQYQSMVATNDTIVPQSEQQNILIDNSILQKQLSSSHSSNVPNEDRVGIPIEIVHGEYEQMAGSSFTAYNAASISRNLVAAPTHLVEFASSCLSHSDHIVSEGSSLLKKGFQNEPNLQIQEQALIQNVGYREPEENGLLDSSNASNSRISTLKLGGLNGTEDSKVNGVYRDGPDNAERGQRCTINSLNDGASSPVIEISDSGTDHDRRASENEMSNEDDCEAEYADSITDEGDSPKRSSIWTPSIPGSRFQKHTNILQRSNGILGSSKLFSKCMYEYSESESDSEDSPTGRKCPSDLGEEDTEEEEEEMKEEMDVDVGEEEEVEEEIEEEEMEEEEVELGEEEEEEEEEESEFARQLPKSTGKYRADSYVIKDYDNNFKRSYVEESIEQAESINSDATSTTGSSVVENLQKPAVHQSHNEIDSCVPDEVDEAPTKNENGELDNRVSHHRSDNS